MVRVLPVMLLLGLVLVACDERGDGLGPETDSWGAGCSSDATCPGALACLCGQCTTPCTASETEPTCQFGTCLDASRVAVCGPSPETPRLCGVRCLDDTECDNLGPSYNCLGGLCLRTGEGGFDLDASLDQADAGDVSEDGEPDGNGVITCRSGDPCDCAAGEVCVLVCPGGGCDAVCEAGSDCVFDCPGGACALSCEGGAQCAVGCEGGLCELTCGAAAECALDCSGGDCDTRCSAGATCDETCAGGCSTTCAGSATCTSDCEADDCRCEGSGC